MTGTLCPFLHMSYNIWDWRGACFVIVPTVACGPAKHNSVLWGRAGSDSMDNEPLRSAAEHVSEFLPI